MVPGLDRGRPERAQPPRAYNSAPRPGPRRPASRRAGRPPRAPPHSRHSADEAAREIAGVFDPPARRGALRDAQAERVDAIGRDERADARLGEAMTRVIGEGEAARLARQRAGRVTRKRLRRAGTRNDASRTIAVRGYGETMVIAWMGADRSFIIPQMIHLTATQHERDGAFDGAPGWVDPARARARSLSPLCRTSRGRRA